jgi:transposase InsO family protein
MKKNLRQAVALFRYAIIAPVLFSNRTTQAEHFRQMSKAHHDVPGLGPRQYQPATFKNWLKKYRQNGLEGLFPKTRSDAGTSRVISRELSHHIREVLLEMPLLSTTRLREKLVDSGHITSRRISEATLSRHIRQNQLPPTNTTPIKARKHFEKPFANDLWIMDFMHGPRLKTSSKRAQKTYLVAAIDDHSRFLTLGCFYTRENAQVVVTALKLAFGRHHLPRILYCDNGAPFSSQLLTLGCARLGVALVHSKPYDPSSRGKVERFFRTVRRSFLAELNDDSLSVDQLNDRFHRWLDQRYHRRSHSSTGEPPIERFLRSLGSIRPRIATPMELDRVFYRTLFRTVRNDATVSIQRCLWEVPPQYIGSRIEIRHPEARPNQLFLFEQDQAVARLQRVDAAQNANSPQRPRFNIQNPEDPLP